MPLSAQRVELYGRLGAAGSTALVTDAVATPQVAQLLNARVDEEVRAIPAPALAVGGGIRVAFWERARLVADVEWSGTELRVEEGGGTRPVQDLSVLHATLGASFAVRPALEVGGGAGLLRYITDESGLFTEGSSTSPVVEARAAWTPSFWARRVALAGSVQTHRFGTPVLRDAGGTEGQVFRYALTARVRLVEAGR